MSESWSVTHASGHEAKRALRNLRGNWGSRAKDHMAVEAVRVLIIVVVFLLAVAEVISPENLLAFIFGYFGFALFFRWARPRLLLVFGPSEFAVVSGGTVTVDQSGLHTKSDDTSMHLAWSRVPPPTIYDTGLVFRIAHEVALPFPTESLDTSPKEIAETVRRWKAGQPT